jgi:hypothetical protein
MSEYQYYEFAAIDGPISDEGLRYARSCSSRANVSRVRWQNTYTFGDFHGSVDTLLKYYDAHFYIAMDQKIASAYDQVAAQLRELREAYAQAGDSSSFQKKLRGFRLRYSNRPAMLRRIQKL